MREDQQVVMITGAAGNLGRAVADAFAAAGYALVLIDRGADRWQAGMRSDGRLQIAADLMEPGDVQAAVRSAIAAFGRIDVLCNIAGGFRMGEAVHETTPQTWDFLLDLNARTIVHTANAVVPSMLARGSGRIVNVAAQAGRQGGARMGAYSVSKSAVLRLTESMAAELREQGINVNCVVPGTLDTPENRQSMPDADPSRWVAPPDLAAVVLFLASDAARAVHGAAVPVVGLG